MLAEFHFSNQRQITDHVGIEIQTSNQNNEPTQPSIPILESRLVEDEPEFPVYNKVPIPANDAQHDLGSVDNGVEECTSS